LSQLNQTSSSVGSEDEDVGWEKIEEIEIHFQVFTALIVTQSMLVVV
jgi:hypothetical protein